MLIHWIIVGNIIIIGNIMKYTIMYQALPLFLPTYQMWVSVNTECCSRWFWDG